MKEYKDNQKVYIDINEHVAKPLKKEELIPNINFESVKRINEDIFAWIYIENLGISYPIVKGNNNDYYLTHDITKKYNRAGSIYLDYRNSMSLDDKNNIIYGHNMLDGTMFSKLTKYNKQKYYDKYPYYVIVTEDKAYKINIFAGYDADVYDGAWNLEFNNEKSFDKWINYLKEKSSFKSNIIPTFNDNIITLSTCSYEFDNARFVLFGVITEINN